MSHVGCFIAGLGRYDIKLWNTIKAIYLDVRSMATETNTVWSICAVGTHFLAL